MHISLTSFAVIVICINVYAIPMVEKGLRYEEYIIEHEISSGQAKNSVLSIDLNTVKSPPGCQKCTNEEIAYCLGGDLISDHCCCDRRYHEVLPFIPHTCYLGPKVCRPVVGDCDEYSRLRTCCCDRYALEKWKKKSGTTNNSGNTLAVVTLLFLYHIVQRLYII